MKILLLFLAHNSFAMNATWASVNVARVRWQADGLRVELFKLFTRKIKYDVFGLPTYGKWKAGVQSHALMNGEDHEEVGDKMKDNNEDGFMKEAGVHLYLDQAFSWEIRVVMNDDKNKSAAIFIDPPMVAALGKQRRRMRRKQDGNKTATATTKRKRTGATTEQQQNNVRKQQQRRQHQQLQLQQIQ
jgi:hypothetical protein